MSADRDCMPVRVGLAAPCPPPHDGRPAQLLTLSLGAGVQSTTIALMAAERRLPKPDLVLFADTGWEPAAVYEHLHRLEPVLGAAGMTVRRVSAGNLRNDALDPAHRYASIPYHTRKVDGGHGMGRRQCTAEYKIAPINRAIREALGAAAPHFRRVPRGQQATVWIGFSADEIGRVRDSQVSYTRHAYPLIDLGMDREAYRRWLDHRGWTVAKSACIGCLIWNLIFVRLSVMTMIDWSKFPLVTKHEHARRWLQFTANIGRAPNTVLAYGRAVEDHLRFCIVVGADPLTARADVVAGWIGDMHERPGSRRSNPDGLDCGVGLSNATILQRTITAAYRKADYFARNVRTIQVLIDRESILTGAAAGGEQPWKYYDLGDGYCSYDFFAKCPHRLACAKCSFYLPKQSNAGQLLAVKDGIDQMLEQLDLTDDERAALEGDLEALTALANRLADVATPSGPTPNELGNGTAFIPLTALRTSLREGPP